MSEDIFKDIDQPNADHLAMMALWKPAIDLMGTSKTMRDASETYNPSAPKEDPDGYKQRKDRTFLYGGYSKAVKRQVSKPFSKTITLKNADGLPMILQPIEKNADNEGNDLTQFARNVMQAGHIGLSHILVDMPKKEIGNQDLVSGTSNPYFSHITAPNMLDWDGTADADGKKRVTYIRYKGETTARVCDHKQERSVFVQIYKAAVETLDKDGKVTETKPGYWWYLEKSADGTFFIKDQGAYMRTSIPLVTYYTNRTGFMMGEPGQQELIDLNLEHYQKSSNINYTLWYQSHGEKHYAGFTEKDVKKIPASAPNARSWGSPESHVDTIEYAASAVGVAIEERKDLEERMESVGNEPLLSRKGDVKATGIAVDDNSRNTDIQAHIQALNKVIRQCYELAAELVRVEVPDDFEAKIYDKFPLPMRGTENVKLIIEMATGEDPLLTKKTALEQIKIYGVLTGEVNPEKEIEALKIQNPLSGMVGLNEAIQQISSSMALSKKEPAA